MADEPLPMRLQYEVASIAAKMMTPDHPSAYAASIALKPNELEMLQAEGVPRHHSHIKQLSKKSQAIYHEAEEAEIPSVRVPRQAPPCDWSYNTPGVRDGNKRRQRQLEREPPRVLAPHSGTPAIRLE